MKAQDLKNSILQLAIQGKLVEQDADDEPAEVLFAKIQAEKQKLIKEGKIKKDKPLPPITEDEIPFSIPPSWKWVRLGNIAIINGGFAFKSTQYKDNGIRVIRISDFDEQGLKNNKIVRYEYRNDLEQYLIERNNIIMAMTGGTVGKSYFVSYLEEPMVSNQRVATIKINHRVYPEYINIAILTPVVQKLIQISKNSTNDNISMDLINNFPIPLPPLAEQHRIVAKIEELEPLVKQYDKAETELSTLNKSFPEQLKKSILQYAIQGKLVEQDADDEPAEVLFAKIQAEKQKLIKEGKIKKDKPLPPITEDEIPFSIPPSWKWVRLGEIFAHNTGKALNSSKRDGRLKKYITTSNVYWNYFKLDELREMYFNDYEIQKCTITKGDLLVCEGGDFGRAAIWNYDYDMCIQNHIHRLKAYFPVCIMFFYYLFFLYKISGYIGGKGIGIQGLSSGVLHNIIFPLPPLAEQHRIVAKVDELMQYCEKLKL